MRRSLLIPGLLTGTLLLFAGAVHAQTPIGGPVTTNTALLTSDSPFIVTDDLVVQNGATLSIQPGVSVYVASGVNIVINAGALRSDGTETDPVLITSELDDGGGTPAPGDWGVLRFENNTNDAATRMTWTTLRYGSGVALEAASPNLSFCSIESMAGPAISMDLDSFPAGLGNSATACDLNGILVPAGDITAPGSWSLRGIPYVVQGRVSVGLSPAVSGVSPSEVQRLSTVDIVVTGQRLGSVSAFELDGTGVTHTILGGGNATTLNVRLDVAEDASLGARNFAVVTPAGRAESSDAALVVTVTPAVPILTAISPDNVVAGSGDFTLTVNGDRFTIGAEVVVDGTPVPTTRLSVTQMTADVPGALITTAGSVDVLVRNPDPLNAGAFLESVPRTLTIESPQITLSPDPLFVITGEVSNLILSIPLSAPTGGLVFDVESSNVAVATVPANVTVPQGGSSVPVPVTGGTTGIATITATRVGFVTATADAQTVPPPILIPTTPLMAPLVGVQVGDPPTPDTDLPVNPMTAPLVGVTVGAALFDLSPDRAEQGSSGVTVVASGIDLDAVTSVDLDPPDDLTVVGVPVVAPDGSTVTFTLDVAAAAEPIPRRVLLQTATGPVPPVAPDADQFLITRPVPQILSVAPNNAEPGSIISVIVNGTNLQGATLVQASPPDGLIFANPPSVNGAGTQATLNLQVDPAAVLGARVLTITTPAGTSTSTGSAANTLNVVADLGEPIFPLMAPLVGVIVEEPPAPDPQVDVNPMLATSVGVIVGTGITGVTPDRANVGTDNLDLTITGAGLEGTTAVSFDPPDGITINSGPTAAPDGFSVALNVSVAADAPTSARLVRVESPSGFARPTAPGADQFTVTLPPPELISLLPIRGLVDTASLTLTVNGKDLTGATEVSFTPPDGIGVSNPPTVTNGGTRATVNISIDAAAPLGIRVVRITTPGGISIATASPGNSFEVTDQPGTPVFPLVAPLVGVTVAEPDVPEPPLNVDPLMAPLVGVTVAEPDLPEPPLNVTPLLAPSVGVVVGAALTGISPTSAVPGAANLDVTVTGINLDAANLVEVVPPDDITINSGPTVLPDGNSLDLNLSIAIGAQRGFRRFLVSQPSGVIPSIARETDQFFVGDPPEITSIDPNVVAIGSTFILTVNGIDLDYATSVDFIPPDDVLVGALSVNAAGTQLTVPIVLAGSVTPGARVVTVTTPAGTSTTTAGPNNTLNIVGGGALLAPSPLETEPEAPALDAPSDRQLGTFAIASRSQMPLGPGSFGDPVEHPAGVALLVTRAPEFTRPGSFTRLSRSDVEPKNLAAVPGKEDSARTRHSAASPPTAIVHGGCFTSLLPRPPTSRPC